MTTPATTAPGLVTMLDLAGRTITALEGRIDRLTANLDAERRQRAEVEALLARLRAEHTGHPSTYLPACADTGHVDPPGLRLADDEHHAHRPATLAP